MRRILIPPDLVPEAPPASWAVETLAGLTMGTTWSVQAVLPSPGAASELRPRLQAVLDGVVAEMSHWEETSCLARFNQAEGGSWHQLPEGFAHVLVCALEVAETSEGAYDPASGALVNLWGFGPRRRYDQQGFTIPAPAAIEALLARDDLHRLRFDVPTRRLLQPGGVQLDFSSIAKGYAVDLVAAALRGAGLGHFLVEVGGELRGEGTKPDGMPWWVTLEKLPGQDGDSDLAALHGVSVATSGDYRRYFDHGGRRHSHTLDPRTGYPITNEVASVTVLHRECMRADAWSTALTVLGAQAGLALAERHGLAARFLLRSAAEVRELTSSAFDAMLS
jgi:thiamine biosynthesis lipoprotein